MRSGVVMKPRGTVLETTPAPIAQPSNRQAVLASYWEPSSRRLQTSISRRTRSSISRPNRTRCGSVQRNFDGCTRGRSLVCWPTCVRRRDHGRGGDATELGCTCAFGSSAGHQVMHRCRLVSSDRLFSSDLSCSFTTLSTDAHLLSPLPYCPARRRDHVSWFFARTGESHREREPLRERDLAPSSTVMRYVPKVRPIMSSDHRSGTFPIAASVRHGRAAGGHVAHPLPADRAGPWIRCPSIP